MHGLKDYYRGYRRRIVISLMFFLLVIFVPLLLYGTITDRRLITDHIDNTGRYLVKNLAQNSELGVFTENRGYLNVPLHAIFSQEDVVWAAVYNLKGELIAEEHKIADFDPRLPDKVLSKASAPSQGELYKQNVSIHGREVLDFFCPVHLRPVSVAVEYEDVPSLEPRQRCIGFARVGMSLQRMRSRTIAIMRTGLLLGVLYLMIGFFVVWFVARAITRPVRQLEAAARDIGGGNLGVRIVPATDDELGSLAHTFNAMTDRLQHQMAKRQEAEQQMQRLILAVEQAAEMVIVLDKSGCVQYANPATRHIVGLQQGELLGLNPFMLERSSDQAERVAKVWQEISAGNTWSGSLVQRLKDGSERLLEQTIAPVRDDTGSIIGFVVIGRDVTREHILEERLRQAQKMEAIGTLAGGIAHDFNNILAAIIGYAELSCSQQNLDSGLRYNLEQILKASNRAADLVRQILAFSRKSLQEQKPVEFNKLLKESVQLLRASIPTTIDIQLKLPEEKVMIMADASQMHQVIINLCTNAAQAIGDRQGLITIQLGVCELQEKDGELEPGSYAKLTVQDNGPGIPSEIIGHIFEPFFTTKPVGKGTGMGLAVVDGIVKSHHGAVRVTSQPGAGATFDIFIPQLFHTDHHHPVADQEPLPCGTERILFVDDEVFLVDTSRRLLTGLGYQVTAVQSSREALALIRENPEGFDLIITDQTMPGMSGIELARAILKIRPTMPIILCSGYSDAVTPERATAEGVRFFLYKPVDKHTLATTLRQALAS